MELADALDSKSCGSDTVSVRPRSPAPKKTVKWLSFFIQVADLVYHHAKACISSPEAYIITEGASSATWWYTTPCAGDMQFLQNWWYTKLTPDKVTSLMVTAWVMYFCTLLPIFSQNYHTVFHFKVYPNNWHYNL